MRPAQANTIDFIRRFRWIPSSKRSDSHLSCASSREGTGHEEDDGPSLKLGGNRLEGAFFLDWLTDDGRTRLDLSVAQETGNSSVGGLSSRGEDRGHFGVRD